MPWTVSDVEKHKKGLTPAQKKRWVASGNNALAQCKAGKAKPREGQSCEAYAIMVANKAAVKSKRDWDFGERSQIIRETFDREAAASGEPYMYVAWIFDDYLVARKSGRYYKVGYVFSDSGDVEISDRSTWAEVSHEFAAVARALYGERATGGKTCKREAGKCFPASDYLVVEDSKKPSTWHLRVTKTPGGPKDRGQCGAAWAALFSPGGHRGQRYKGPQASKAKAKLRGIYKSQGWETPGSKRDVPISMLCLEPIRAVPNKKNRYRAYAVLFSTPEERDLYGTWFDRGTNYCLDYYDKWPWLYHHGRRSGFGSRKVGTWDEKGIDDVGVFVEGEITAHSVYREAVEQLISEGVLFTSSQAISSMAIADEHGHVRLWPICEVSSTVTPGDYRLKYPVSPAAERAVRVLERSSETMSWKDKLKELVDALPDVRSADETTDDDETETENDEGDGETMEMEFDAEEMVRAVVELTQVDKIIEAVRALDEAVKAITERLGSAEEAIRGLAQREPERIKDVIAGEDWYKSLFVATRDTPPEDVGNGGGDDDTTTEPLADDETVFGRICVPPGS